MHVWVPCQGPRHAVCGARPTRPGAVPTGAVLQVPCQGRAGARLPRPPHAGGNWAGRGALQEHAAAAASTPAAAGERPRGSRGSAPPPPPPDRHPRTPRASRSRPKPGVELRQGARLVFGFAQNAFTPRARCGARTHVSPARPSCRHHPTPAHPTPRLPPAAASPAAAVAAATAGSSCSPLPPHPPCLPPIPRAMLTKAEANHLPHGPRPAPLPPAPFPPSPAAPRAWPAA